MLSGPSRFSPPWRTRRPVTLPVRVLARETAGYLRSLANRIVIRNHAYAQTLRDRYLQILLETATSFAAVLLASIYFTIRFVRRINENIRTRQLLVEQERLADLVINNVEQPRHRHLR